MANILFAGQKNNVPAAVWSLLANRGYRIQWSSNLRDVISRIFDFPPDILIVEISFHENRIGELIKAARGCLQKANIPILLVLEQQDLLKFDVDSLPIDDFLALPFSPEIFLARIQLANSRSQRVFDNNPLSRLPGNTSILRNIQNRLDAGTRDAVCYVDIDNFKPYNDRYGFSMGDDIILMVARIIVNVVEEYAREGSFVGHVGGDDFVFIVDEKLVVPVCERILLNFDTVRRMFIPDDDLKAGGYTEKDRQGRVTHFGLVSLSIAVVPFGRERFKHSGEVSAAASQVKHQVKKLAGSNYMIDQREAYFSCQAEGDGRQPLPS